MNSKTSKKNKHNNPINDEVKNMIYNLENAGILYQVDSGVEKIINNLSQIDNKQIISLHNLLLEQLFLNK